jgi:hypothetical protein
MKILRIQKYSTDTQDYPDTVFSKCIFAILCASLLLMFGACSGADKTFDFFIIDDWQ